MGGPKQMWTQEEETALRAGVRKHGAGKWRRILADHKYARDLKARSNVDLKDKWRNISGPNFGSGRKRAKTAFQNKDEDDDNATPLAIVANGDDEELVTSVDTFILEAITSLKSVLNPNKKSIVRYVEENMQRGMRQLVSSRLKHLVNVGTIIRKNNRYKISPTSAATEAEQSPPQLLLEGNKENDVEIRTKAQVDGEVFKINGMTQEEASAAVAIALEEAEFARAEAEEAAEEAERAEAEAEAMKNYAEAVNEIWKDFMRSQTWY